jgi:hypothetical protein
MNKIDRAVFYQRSLLKTVPQKRNLLILGKYLYICDEKRVYASFNGQHIYISYQRQKRNKRIRFPKQTAAPTLLIRRLILYVF